MEFSPANPIVKLCIQGMVAEEQGQIEKAKTLYSQAWSEAAHDFEKFIAAFFLARCQKSSSDKLKWLESALQVALKMNDDRVKSALPLLYLDIAKCHEDLNESERANKNHELAASCDDTPCDQGPFFHGTRADLQVGDMLTAGRGSNYEDDLKMNHIYFTAVIHGAGLAAGLAKGDEKERVYVVEPMGTFENDPNVTNKKFPGNPTRSYRSEAPLKVVGEVTDWEKQTPEELEKWREKLATINKGEIIN